MTLEIQCPKCGRRFSTNQARVRCWNCATDFNTSDIQQEPSVFEQAGRLVRHIFFSPDGRSGFTPNAEFSLSNVSPEIQELERGTLSALAAEVGQNGAQGEFAKRIGVPHETCLVLIKIMWEYKRKFGSLHYQAGNCLDINEVFSPLAESERPEFDRFKRRL